jgi:hypothetical protein
MVSGSGFPGTPCFPFPKAIRPRHAGRLVPGFGETPGFHSRRSEGLLRRNPSTPRWPIGSGFRGPLLFSIPGGPKDSFGGNSPRHAGRLVLGFREHPGFHSRRESVHVTLADWFRVLGNPPVFHSRRSEGLLRRKQSTSRVQFGSGFRGTPRFPFPEGIRPRHARCLVSGSGFSGYCVTLRFFVVCFLQS